MFFLIVNLQSGLCKLWTISDCKHVRTFHGHIKNAWCISWHPQSTLTQDPAMINLASTSFETSVKLGNLQCDEPIAEIEGHAPFRVSKVKCHSSGRFLATACTEGHYLVTVSYDNTIKLTTHPIWSALYSSKGHEQKIMSAALSRDGRWIATVSYDRTFKIWSAERIC
ncbi:unnamed protein product [Rotaria magnacalcarata]|uniref:Uncharacterized protein n=1 Tax=Rotaria magnacalcarata TaxID=392030 RepID=A0A815I926_9BILA|nr:unnamed protein product [Rotaria magnacalcarata]